MMGVERAATRWYVQRQGILSEISSLTTRLAQLPEANTEGAEHAEQAEHPVQQERADLGRQLAAAHARLLDLGPCPKPMMG